MIRRGADQARHATAILPNVDVLYVTFESPNESFGSVVDDKDHLRHTTVEMLQTQKASEKKDRTAHNGEMQTKAPIGLSALKL